mgnify:CR=1 FL=1
MAEQKMLPIWFFVGLMLTVIGSIVTAMGVYYLVGPEPPTVLGHLNPDLWWGGVMVVSGLAFLIPSWLHYKRES